MKYISETEIIDPRTFLAFFYFHILSSKKLGFGQFAHDLQQFYVTGDLWMGHSL